MIPGSGYQSKAQGLMELASKSSVCKSWEIAALLVKIFVEIEGNQFERRLEEVLKIISLEINFDHFNQVNFLCIKTTMLLFEIILLFLEHEWK